MILIIIYWIYLHVKSIRLGIAGITLSLDVAYVEQLIFIVNTRQLNTGSAP